MPRATTSASATQRAREDRNSNRRSEHTSGRDAGLRPGEGIDADDFRCAFGIAGITRDSDPIIRFGGNSIGAAALEKMVAGDQPLHVKRLLKA